MPRGSMILYFIFSLYDMPDYGRLLHTKMCGDLFRRSLTVYRIGLTFTFKYRFQ